MWKSLHIDPKKCTGCLQCEMACSVEHTGVINPSKSRIKVFNFHDFSLSFVRLPLATQSATLEF